MRQANIPSRFIFVAIAGVGSILVLGNCDDDKGESSKFQSVPFRILSDETVIITDDAGRLVVVETANTAIFDKSWALVCGAEDPPSWKQIPWTDEVVSKEDVGWMLNPRATILSVGLAAVADAKGRLIIFQPWAEVRVLVKGPQGGPLWKRIATAKGSVGPADVGWLENPKVVTASKEFLNYQRGYDLGHEEGRQK